MPTYVVYAAPNTLTPRTKAALAKAIGKRHSLETGAPEYLTQVVFNDAAER
jgi:phenylpyruvate tautomerase PptA (4-oxalocrotonate tautomerase family)